MVVAGDATVLVLQSYTGLQICAVHVLVALGEPTLDIGDHKW